MPRTGVDVLIAIEDEDGDKKFIGGQREATLNREKEEIDATHKLTAGWAYNLAGQGSWSIEMDGVMLEDDESLELLDDAFENDETIHVHWTNKSGTNYEGDAILTDYPIEAPMDDVMTYSMTFNGQGKYTKTRRSDSDNGDGGDGGDGGESDGD
ncbi:phage major tail protein, TP901-1 family [Salicibibacter cibarius]|uniref:Phage major tail protein, TP901-1 family n=1 Tax=Salicibibacter cibarius TaxID=2743000 RepID=A0A7T7CAS2_9BACI|nr:phage major tail protein, TP901-1 family [Salicibibacter cibarius]QQK75155.1 phage major tail protein, TP901-1 family [Salicibibacter cibarius]